MLLLGVSYFNEQKIRVKKKSSDEQCCPASHCINVMSSYWKHLIEVIWSVCSVCANNDMKSSVVCASLVRRSLSIVVPQVRISAEILVIPKVSQNVSWNCTSQGRSLQQSALKTNNTKGDWKVVRPVFFVFFSSLKKSKTLLQCVKILLNPRIIYKILK